MPKKSGPKPKSKPKPRKPKLVAEGAEIAEPVRNGNGFEPQRTQKRQQREQQTEQRQTVTTATRKGGRARQRGDGECPAPLHVEAVIDPNWCTGEGAVALAWQTMKAAMSGVKVGTAQTQAAKEILKAAGEFDKLKAGKMDGMVFEIVLADLHTGDDDDEDSGNHSTPEKGQSPDTS